MTESKTTPDGWVLIPTHIKVKGHDKPIPISSIHYVEEDESGDGPLGTCISVEGAIEVAERPL